MACVYLGVAMPALVDFGADWDDPEECYGWSPLSRMYRTVYWSLMLHGGTLTMLLVVLGVDNFRWLVGLAFLWSLVLPLYTVIPWLVFRRVRTLVADRRMRDIDAGLENDLQRSEFDTQKRDFRRLAKEQRQAVANARIVPLRLPRLQVPPFIVLGLFPIILTILSVWFSLSFGPK
jgi:pimeloyl-ACP methyl ester carboxylesterase